MSKHILASATLAVAISTMAGATWAHHGFGLFQMQIDRDWSGTLTKVELVNPHSYLYFDAVDSAGNIQAMRCEMRAASVIRRMGWDTSMFKPGSLVEIHGHPHRDDPGACFLETFTLDENVEVNRYETLSSVDLDISTRPLALPSGEPNISGDWAIEQTILTVPPAGGDAIRIPANLREAFARGDLTLDQVRARDLTPVRTRPVYTAAGQAAADAFTDEDNPQYFCKPTSIILDWIDDWPVNRITQTTAPQGEKVIDISYGLITTSRRIYMDMDSHPANLEPSNAGHSIGHWEGNTLVVDSVGFEEGVLIAPTRNSEQLHIIERYILNPEDLSLRREWTAMDPVYLMEPMSGHDVARLSSVPYQDTPCRELTPEFLQE